MLLPFNNSTCLSKKIHLSHKKRCPVPDRVRSDPFCFTKKDGNSSRLFRGSVWRNESEKLKTLVTNLYIFFEARAKKGSQTETKPSITIMVLSETKPLKLMGKE